MKKTPLYEAHLRQKAKIVDFGGWALPVQYSGVKQEHLAVRTNVGLFDVSHMGEFVLSGEGALDYLNHLITNDAAILEVGQALYTVMCYPDGGVVDDLIVYRLDKQSYLLVVNASNIKKDWDWIQSQLPVIRHPVDLQDQSEQWALLALQGPKASSLLQKTIKRMDLSELLSFHLAKAQLEGVEVMVARTGYTGEDGFEIFVPSRKAEEIWELLLRVGKDESVLPCGLGARDTLRIEMKFPLYGHELSKETNPLEAGLGWVVKLNKAEFLGREALLKIKEEGGPKRRLVGVLMTEKGIPRQGYSVTDIEGRPIGILTSGTMSPSLNVGIGIAYVESSFKSPDTPIQIQIRDRLQSGIIAKTPFIRRDKK